MTNFTNHNHKLKWFEYEHDLDPTNWPGHSDPNPGFWRATDTTEFIDMKIIGNKFHSEGWTQSTDVAVANDYLVANSNSNVSTSVVGNVSQNPGSPYRGAWATPRYNYMAESIFADTNEITGYGSYASPASALFQVNSSLKAFFDLRLRIAGTAHPGTTDNTSKAVMNLVVSNVNDNVRGIASIIFTTLAGTSKLSVWVDDDQPVYGVIWDRATDAYVFIPSTGDTTSTTRFSNAISCNSARWETTTNSISGDDGCWGIPISGKWDGNSPGPYGYNNAGYGIGNWNAADSSTNSVKVYWGSTTGTTPSCLAYVF
tara:strand:- start:2934 stop:3875 length:942 start_codon:yes stop_codon:yes gene_type:complete